MSQQQALGCRGRQGRARAGRMAARCLAVGLGLWCGQQIAAGQGPTRFECGPGEFKASAGSQSASPLHGALTAHCYDDALAEMKLVTDINVLDPDTQATALCIAARDETADAFDMVHALVLKHGADPNIPDELGFSPLHYASQNGNLAVVRFLVTHGADIDSGVGTEASLTPLFMAYQSGRNRVAEHLKLLGAEEIEESVRMDLEVVAAIQRAVLTLMVDYLVERMEGGASLNQLVRVLHSRLSAPAVKVLEAQGRHDVAERYSNAMELVPEVLDEMPEFGEGVDRRVIVMAAIQATLQKLASQSAQPTERHADSTQ